MAKEDEKPTTADKGKEKAVDGNDATKDTTKDKDSKGKAEEEKLDLPPGIFDHLLLPVAVYRRVMKLQS